MDVHHSAQLLLPAAVTVTVASDAAVIRAVLNKSGRMDGRSARRACAHPKNRFNSTTNSKRRVHTLLFWKLQLGLDFPVPDTMLRDGVWKALLSCEYGIK